MLPDGTEQAKDRRGVIGYPGPGAAAVGPYPHHTLELFALETKLTLRADARRPDDLAAFDGIILGEGALVGRFNRSS